jgi:CHAD domain-containing protein
MAEALLDLEIARLRRDLRVLARRGDCGVFAVLRRIRELRDGKGAETLAVIAALGDRFDAVELHRLRRQVRRLRYAAELSGAVKGQVAPAAADFRILQDELGALHDTYVLSEWFRRQAESCRMRGDRAVGQAATARHERFLEACRAHHQAFLALLPADVVARALAAMGQSRPAA